MVALDNQSYTIQPNNVDMVAMKVGVFILLRTVE